MQTIWKFPLINGGRNVIKMPPWTKILCVQVQRYTPCLWGLVTKDDDINYSDEERTFVIYGTGHDHDIIGGTYIGTFQLNDGELVFHVFEEQTV